MRSGDWQRPPHKFLTDCTTILEHGRLIIKQNGMTSLQAATALELRHQNNLNCFESMNESIN